MRTGWVVVSELQTLDPMPGSLQHSLMCPVRVLVWVGLWGLTANEALFALIARGRVQ